MKFLDIFSLIAILIACVLIILSRWKIFVKKGKPGWASMIPIYNMVVMCDIAELPLWYVIMLFIPVVNIIFAIIIYCHFSVQFGKDKIYGLGLLLFPFLFFPALAMEQGEETRRVNKVVYAILTILFGSFGINKFYAKKFKKGIACLLFCWTLVPTVLSIAEFIAVLTEKADKDGKIAVSSSRRETVLFATSLILFALFILFTVIPWESIINNFSAFSDFNTWLSKLKIGDYAVFSNIIGKPSIVDATTGSNSGIINAFGSWALTDVSIFLLILTAVIALFNEVKFDEFVSNCTNGIKKILPVAITAMLISIVLVVMITTGVNITIANWILKLTKGFNIATTTLTTMISSVLTGDFYYFLSTIGTVYTTAISNSDYYGVVALLIQSIFNLMMFVAPTSVGLIIGLYYLDIPYNKWIKFIWKAFVSILIVVIITALVIYFLV